ncbi:hypothetical protein [Jannaschia sp. 2305UL9-9]|uniref:hypothetical protein n=1 Tax=Jannaschia sp. 2305UL9-9 TaxID=3121638 RepID=UPI0035276CD3
MRSTIAAIVMSMLPLSAQAMDGARPLLLSDAPGAVGAPVLTSDEVKLGHLVAFRPQDDGGVFCIVQLDDELRVDTSALMVAGLMRATDGSLRLVEDAATLADRMKLPLRPR